MSNKYYKTFFQSQGKIVDYIQYSNNWYSHQAIFCLICWKMHSPLLMMVRFGKFYYFETYSKIYICNDLIILGKKRWYHHYMGITIEKKKSFA